ncbi:cytochrome c [Candidatus Poribacteria bacterium]|nr:cytochrome c [Candidatus Poribacteria bacterium]
MKKLIVFVFAASRIAACSTARKQSQPHPPAAPEPIAAEGLDNVLRLSPRVLSGSEPHSPAGFASLEALGVRTIVSVDGAQPDVAAAREGGLRYVHVPIGYDGVPAEAAAALSKVLEKTEGPIYVHCHHGKHRGPAAAAIAVRIETACGSDTALRILEAAHTGTQYKGLYRDVTEFEPAAIEGMSPELHEIAPVESLAARMAGLDRTWDSLKACRSASWETPAGHPDIDPAHEALMAEEALREAARLSRPEHSGEFAEWMRVAEEQAASLREGIESGDAANADAAFAELELSCNRCHESFRN